jgi:hypothetical protein
MRHWLMALSGLADIRGRISLTVYSAVVGIANYFLSPLIANPLIYFGVR